jgi:N-acetyl-beta-hexosaminidase
VALIASLVLLTLAVLPLPASAWNIPGHMLSAIIAYQVLRQENPQTIDKVKALLEKHPWFANQWQARLQAVPAADRDMVLFMQVARWPDDIRIKDRQHNRGPWHYINWPFKPEGQPATVETREPEPVNILTAMAENERVSSFILWVTYTNPYTLLSYSLLSIPRATEDGKVDCHRLSGQLLCSRCRRVKRNFLSLGT